MKINRNNYEAFLIDYLDGTLDATEQEELRLFLEANPEIRFESDGMENAILQVEEVLFTEKGKLKKSPLRSIAGIDENNYEEGFIAFYENDLNDAQQKGLKLFLAQNPQLQKEFQLHKKLLLQPESQIVFDGKEALKRKAGIGFWRIAATGIAAAVVLIFVLFNLFKPEAAMQQRLESPLTDLETRQAGMEMSKEIMPSIFTGMRVHEEMTQEIQRESPGLPESGFTVRERPVLVKVESKTLAVNLSDSRDAGFSLPQQAHAGQSAVVNGDVAPVANGKEKKQRLLGKIIHRNLELLAEKLPKRNKKKSSDPTFVKILDGGILAFRTLTGSEVEMVKTYDSNGRLKAYQIETETLNLNRTIPDSENGQ